MSEKFALSKRITMRLPVTVLEKIPMFSANSINQYVRDAIIEKTQREAMSHHELTTQVARIAIAIENLSNTMANMTINTNMSFAQENLCSQVVNCRIIEDDSFDTLIYFAVAQKSHTDEGIDIYVGTPEFCQEILKIVPRFWSVESSIF